MARPVRTTEDLVERVAIAVYWNSPARLSDPAYLNDIIVSDEAADLPALANVVCGVLDLAAEV